MNEGVKLHSFKLQHSVILKNFRSRLFNPSVLFSDLNPWLENPSKESHLVCSDLSPSSSPVIPGVHIKLSACRLQKCPRKERTYREPQSQCSFKIQINPGTTECRQSLWGNYHFLVRIKRKKKKTLKELRRQNKEAYGEFEAGWGENRTRKY